MKTRSWVTTFGLTSLALLCVAEAERTFASPNDRGSQSRPSNPPSRPSAPAPSRPSAPAPSRPSISAPARPSAPPAARPSAPPQSRPAAPVASRPAPSPAPVAQRPAPREEAPVSRPAPEAPRVQPEPRREQPRYEQPRYEDRRREEPRREEPRRESPSFEPRRAEPRYEEPRRDEPGSGRPGPEVPRDAGAQDGPRYLPPDNSGGASGRDRSTSGGLEGGLSRGRSGAPAKDAPRDDGRVWHPDGGGSYEIERRTPRAPVPSLAGTPRLEGTVPGTPRPGLSSRTGRAPDLGATPRTGDTSTGEALVRLPRSEVTRESILQRYRGRANADLVLPKRLPNGTDLSRARGAVAGNETPRFDERARAAREKSAAPAPRGSVEAARRQRESLDRLDRLRRDAPWRAKPIEDTGRAVAVASDRAAQISIGIGVGFATGVYAGWFWEPSCSPHHAAPYSHWAATFGWPWSYYGHCSYWPFGYGFSWYHGNWGFGWSSCSYGYPYSYASYYPYSYSYWSPAPVYYTTIVNDYGDTDYGTAVVYEEPEARGEGVIVANEDAQRDAPREPSPEVKAALVRGAADYLTLGDDAFRQGRYSDAVHHYARTVEYAPDDGVLYLLLADALFATGDYHYAAFALRRAVELEPRLLDNVIDKHGYYGDPSEFDKQIALAEQYLNEHFLDEDARLVLAANYLFANRPSQCVDLMTSPFSQAVLESPAGRRIHERAEALKKSSNPAQK